MFLNFKLLEVAMSYIRPLDPTPPVWTGDFSTHVKEKLEAVVKLESADIDKLTPKDPELLRKYETGEKWTPAFQKRVLVTVAVALGVFTAIAVAVMAALSTVPAVGLLALLPAGGAVYGCYYLCKMRPDLDNPTIRRQALDLVYQGDFLQIARTYNEEEIVGYGLLKYVTDRFNLSNLDAITYVYEKAIILFIRAYKSLQEKVAEADRGISATYKSGIKPAEDDKWYHRNQLNTADALVTSARQISEQETRQPSLALRGGEILTHTITDIERNKVDADFKKKTRNWDNWRDDCNSNLQKARQAAEKILGDQYLTVLKKALIVAKQGFSSSQLVVVTNNASAPSLSQLSTSSSNSSSSSASLTSNEKRDPPPPFDSQLPSAPPSSSMDAVD